MRCPSLCSLHSLHWLHSLHSLWSLKLSAPGFARAIALVALLASFLAPDLAATARADDVSDARRILGTTLGSLDGAHLDRLRERAVILACGGGANEDIGESWKVADVLGSAGVPNRVDEWGAEWPHDWHTWRAMLPHYLEQLT